MRAPGYYGFSALRSSIRIAKSGFDGFNDCTETHGTFARTRIGKNIAYVIADPVIIRDILVERYPHFNKSPAYAELRRGIGPGMVSSDGEEWKKHRLAAQPFFRKGSIESLIPSMNQSARAALPQADDGGVYEGILNAHSFFATYVLGASLRIFFDERRPHIIPDVAELLDRGDKAVGKRIRKMSMLPSWFPTADNKHYEKIGEDLRATFSRLKSYAKTREDSGINEILSRLNGSEVESLGMIGNLFSASFETTTNALVWAIDDLCLMPDIQDKLREEIHTVCGRRFVDLSVSEIEKLELLDSFIKESLRLRPSIFVMGRTPVKRERLLNGVCVEPGNILLINIAGVHHHPDNWDSPKKFELTRFQNKDSVQMTRDCLYLPFGVGARNCIGAKMAMHEMKIMLAHLLSRYKVFPHEDASKKIVTGFTLRPKEDFPVVLESI